jgi:hypothetical protein
MSKDSNALVMAAISCGLQALALALSFRVTADADDPPGQAPPAEPRVEFFLAPPLPAEARKRIDDRLARLASYDFARAAAALNDPPAIEVMYGGPFPPTRMQYVLSDHRVARLYQFLDAARPVAASLQAAEMADAKLKIHDEHLGSMIAAHRRLPSSRKMQYGKWEDMQALERNFHAVSSAVFLCAAFADPSTVLEKIDRWEEAIGPHVDAVAADPALKSSYLGLKLGFTGFRTLGRPEKAYLLNLYAFMLERHAGLTAAELEQVADIPGPRIYEPPQLLVERVRFCSWDSQCTLIFVPRGEQPVIAVPIDPTHGRAGEPVAHGKVLAELSFARSWHYLESQHAQQDAILTRVRALVEKLDVDRRKWTSKPMR